MPKYLLQHSILDLSLYSSLRLNTANVTVTMDPDQALTIQLYSRICAHTSLECDKFSVKSVLKIIKLIEYLPQVEVYAYQMSSA